MLGAPLGCAPDSLENIRLGLKCLAVPNAVTSEFVTNCLRKMYTVRVVKC